MSGKAIIVLVTGVIIITATIMFNIEAASTRLVKNFSDYYMRQNTQNIAQSGVNLAMTELGKDRKWRAGYEDLKLADGVVDVKVYDTHFDSVPVIAIRSIARTDYGNHQYRRDTSIAYLFWSRITYPFGLRALLTLKSDAGVNGTITLDGRNHDWDGNLLPATGVPAVWTTKNNVVIGSSAALLGGTRNGTDYAPSNPPNGNVVIKNQVFPGGYPTTPDMVFGGADSSFPEGTLKAIAQTGIAGSQYVTDPKDLKFPLAGVTYVEPPPYYPKNEWSSAAIPGSGILIMHNSAGTASLKNSDANFKGLIIGDDIVHLHGDVLGGIIAFKDSLGGNVVGNGSGDIRYSSAAVLASLKFLESDSKPAVLAWWE